MRIYFNRVQLLLWAALFFSAAMIFSLVARAADFPVPEADIASILLGLAMNYKTMGVIGVISALILVSVQAIKAFVPEDFKYKRLITLGVSIVYSVLSGLVVPGSNWVSVVITVFLTSGGAVALYEALKGAGVIKSS